MIQIIFVEKNQLHWFAPFLPALSPEQLEATVVYGALEDSTGTAVGALLAVPAQSVLLLEHICVANSWRRRGIGSQLLRALQADSRDAHSLRRITAELSDQDTAAAALLASCGFAVEDTGTRCTLTLDMLKQGKFWNQEVDSCCRVLPLDQVPNVSLRALSARLEESEGTTPPLPIQPEDYHPQLSLCSIDEEGRIASILLTSQLEDQLYIDYLYAEQDRVRSLAELLQEAAHRALELYPPRTRVQLAAVNRASQALAERLLPQADCGMLKHAEYDLIQTGEVIRHGW